ESQDTIMIGDSRVGVTDVVRSDGGLGHARLTAAVMVTHNFALGAAIGLHTGSLERQVDRTFGDSTIYNPFTTQIRWEYSGLIGAVGARSEERRVGKESRTRHAAEQQTKQCGDGHCRLVE